MYVVGDSRRAARLAVGLAILMAIYFAPRTLYVWLSIVVLATMYGLLRARSWHENKRQP